MAGSTSGRLVLQGLLQTETVAHLVGRDGHAQLVAHAQQQQTPLGTVDGNLYAHVRTCKVGQWLVCEDLRS